MQSKLTKTWLIVGGLLVHAASFANTTLLSLDDSPKMRSLDSRVAALERSRGPTGMINPPVRPIVEDYDFNFFGDFLIWQAHEDGLPIAIKNRATNFDTQSAYLNFQNSEVKRLDFDYNTGFRLGVAFDLPHDGWDVSLTWLRLDSTAKQKSSVTGIRELFASRISPQIGRYINPLPEPAPIPSYQEANAHWKCYLNQLDLDMGREFFVSKWATLRPHFGLRTTWMRQRLRTQYEDGILVVTPVSQAMPDVEVHEKNKWWGLGLEGGLDTQFRLGYGLSLFGNVTAAIEYGYQKVRTTNDINFSSDDVERFEGKNDSYRTSRPVLDLQMGLSWERLFADGRFNFGMHAGWEHHIYFSQNQFNNDTSYGQVITNQGDLSYQGWTIGAHIAL